MIRNLVLPKIGMNMVEGTIVEWLVKPGDRVVKDQVVVRAETDKAVQDIFATDSGILLRILAQAGDTVNCQEPIALIGDAEDEAEAAAKTNIEAPVTEADVGKPAAENAGSLPSSPTG